MFIKHLAIVSSTDMNANCLLKILYQHLCWKTGWKMEKKQKIHYLFIYKRIFTILLGTITIPCPLGKYIEHFFLIVKTKSRLSTFVSIFSTIFQISKTKFRVFLRETCRNWTKLFTWTCDSSQVSHTVKT